MLSSRSWTSPNTSPAERVQCFGDFVSELLRAQTWRFQRMRREGEIFTFPGQLGSWCRTRITRCHRNGCRNTVVKVHPDSPAVWSPGENFDHFNFVEGMCVAHHYRFLRPVWVPFAVQKNSSNPVDSPVAISWVSVRHPSLADFDTVTMPQQGLDSEWFTLVPNSNIKVGNLVFAAFRQQIEWSCFVIFIIYDHFTWRFNACHTRRQVRMSF